MKKLLFSLLLFMLFPALTYAEVDYDITDYYIESHILANGDVKVQELFVLDGTFNGYERDILYTNSSLSLKGESIDFSNNAIYNASGIKDISIKAKYVDDVNFDTMKDNDFTTFNVTNYASNGSTGLYIKTLLNGGERYRMYYASNNNRVAFYLTYTVTEAVVIHNDVAEFYWNFIGEDYEDELNNLNIKVYLPEEDQSDNFRIWAHGDVTGEIDFLGNAGAYAKMENVAIGSQVDIRMTFDKSLITDGTNLDHSNVNALDKIIEVETERANEANELRNILKAKYYGVVTTTIIYFVAYAIMLIIIIKKYGLDKKSDFEHEYNREFIDDYNVEVVDYLINRKNITPNAMSASIMNLVYKKNLSVEEIITSKTKKDYKFTLLTEENINDSEKKLIDFLFIKIGKCHEQEVKTFKMSDLEHYASSSKTCESFINSYTAWKRKVISDGEAQGFYENTKKAIIYGIIALVIAIILNVVAYNWGVDFIPTYLTIVAGVIFFIYTILNTKKSSKGALHYAKWMSFKRFLNDFGNFKEKELPEIVLWERYLVYAVVFGIADKVEKAMNVKIKEIANYTDTTYPNVVIYNTHITNSISRSINNSVRNSYEKQAANQAAAASRSSSGSGFGGGFSSGGGFGGGGGGGRGF